MTNYFGWQPSLLSRDLSSGSEWGSMNIHMNQAWADMQARSTLYMTPTTSWSAFCDYGTPSGGMNFLVDPRYTMTQFQWNQNAMSNGGFNWGNFNGGFNMSNPWGNFGWNGGNTSGTGSSAATPEEREYQKKYNKLLSLVKQLASDDSKLPAARKDALDEIAKHPVGKNYEEKFKNLKTEYDRVSKNEIKKFLASKAAIKFGIDGKEVSEGNSFYGKLQSVGYEFTNSKVDDQIAGLYDVISQIRDTQEGYQNSSILSDLAAKTGTYDILDVISSWNTQKKDSTAGDKRIIDLIKKGYDALPAGDEGKGARSSVKTNIISPIVNGLINRARELNEKVDSASQAKITAAITKLENSYNNTNDKVDANMSKAFDELYLLTRKAAIAQLRTEINEVWGAIDPDVFNDNLFEEDTKADLKAEGFDDTAINAAAVVVPQAEDSGDFSRRIDDTKPARQQLEAITGTDNALSKATSVSGIAGVTEAWIDNNTGKVYVLKQNADGEDEIHELNNPTVANGKVTAGTVGAKVSANDIATASSAAKQEAQDLKTEQEAVTALVAKTEILTKQADKATIGGKQYDVYKETKGDERELVLIDGVLYEYKDGAKGDKVTAASIETAYNSAVDKENASANDREYEGQEVARKLCDWTTASDDQYISDRLNEINDDNVMSFMKGIYSNSSFDHKGCEGFIEKLDDDTSGDTVKFAQKQKLIKCFINAAVKGGMSETDPLIKALKDYSENGRDGNSEDYTKTYSGWGWTFCGTDYNEKIDEVMFDIYKKLNP